MKMLDMLASMNTERRADHAELVKKVDAGFADTTAALVAHTREDDARFAEIKLELQPLTELRKGVVWAKRTLYGAASVAVLAEAAHILLTRVKP